MYPQAELRSQERERISWYVLCVRSNREKCVKELLANKGLEHFLPTYRVSRQWKNGCRVQLDRPLFPGYIFTKISYVQRLHVLTCPGALCFVTFRGEPVALEDAEIESLRSGISRCNAEPHPYLQIGDSVRVLRGPFAGMEGFLVRTKNHCRVVISVASIGKSIVVDLNLADLDKLPAITSKHDQPYQHIKHHHHDKAS
ncbi:MAG TPA: UpxY family transcription antiterminator [Candidatus Dormibacteraeota bacterium]|jgi:transcription antitermination factor NusG|nr:UpxY family transcription antiterminator [Candidatus Dormibacteraeota bacterium]